MAELFREKITEWDSAGFQQKGPMTEGLVPWGNSVGHKITKNNSPGTRQGKPQDKQNRRGNSREKDWISNRFALRVVTVKECSSIGGFEKQYVTFV